MSLGKFNQVKFGSCEDLQVFGEPVQVNEGCDDNRQRLNRAVGLPHGISGMLRQSVKSKQFGQSFAILW